jgi:hypothetical protein
MYQQGEQQVETAILELIGRLDGWIAVQSEINKNQAEHNRRMEDEIALIHARDWQMIVWVAATSLLALGSTFGLVLTSVLK